MCSDTRLHSISRGDFIVPRFNRQLSNSSFSIAARSAWNRLPSHIRTSSTYTLFLTRLKTHLFAESLLWHCYAVVFSLYFWRPRALDVGRHSKFMLIDWLIEYLQHQPFSKSRSDKCNSQNNGIKHKNTSEKYTLTHWPLSSCVVILLPTLHNIQYYHAARWFCAPYSSFSTSMLVLRTL